MKPCLFLSLLALTAVAQNPTAPAPVAPPTPRAVPAAPAVAPRPEPPEPPDAFPAPDVHVFRNKRVTAAQGQTPDGEEDLVISRGPGGAVAIAGGGGGLGAGGGFGGDMLFMQGPKPGRSLVIQSTEPEPAALADAEEDLSIMSRILEKAVSPGREEDEVNRAMGIAVLSLKGLAGGSAGGVRNLYLDGYGALFTLNARFPLLPPAETKDEAKPKEAASTEWEEVRDELYGGRTAQRDFDRAGNRFTKAKPEPYDAEKVESLKSSLFGALKNATHIRSLKPNESVTVVVLGGEATRRTARRKGTPAPTPKPEDAARVERDRAKAPAARGETTMTVQVKKSDVDAFAKGKMNLEEFRRKVNSYVYVRRPEMPVGPGNTFNTPLPPAQ